MLFSAGGPALQRLGLSCACVRPPLRALLADECAEKLPYGCSPVDKAPGYYKCNGTIVYVAANVTNPSTHTSER